MNKKFFIAFFIIVAIIATGGILWYAQKETKKNEEINAPVDQVVEIDADDSAISHDNTQEGSADILYNEDGSIDTSNWQTYRNEEYGFEVKYPQGWGIGEAVDGQMIIKNNISDCDLVPTGCPIVVLYDKREYFNSDYVSIDIMQGYTENLSKTSQWEGIESMLGGCHIKAIKKFGKNNSISFFSFYEAKNLNDEKQIIVDRSICQKNLLNPYFDEIVKNFKEI